MRMNLVVRVVNLLLEQIHAYRALSIAHVHAYRRSFRRKCGVRLEAIDDHFLDVHSVSVSVPLAVLSQRRGSEIVGLVWL